MCFLCVFLEVLKHNIRNDFRDILQLEFQVPENFKFVVIDIRGDFETNSTPQGLNLTYKHELFQ